MFKVGLIVAVVVVALAAASSAAPALPDPPSQAEHQVCCMGSWPGQIAPASSGVCPDGWRRISCELVPVPPVYEPPPTGDPGPRATWLATLFLILR
jgi:hypothetical protein